MYTINAILFKHWTALKKIINEYYTCSFSEYIRDETNIKMRTTYN